MRLANQLRRRIYLAMLVPLAAVLACDAEGLALRRRLASQIDGIASRCYPPGLPGAAIIVKYDGRVLFAKGYGLANAEWAEPVTPRTAFRIGSVTKQFTAMAVLLLVRDGLVSLDDPVGKYLPVFSGRKISVENLLTHTSGLRNYTTLEGYGLWSRLDLTRREMMALLASQPADFEPGEDWIYSDSGYYLLGLIVETISGKRYDEFLRERIFRPLGMVNTNYEFGGDIIPMRASGYLIADGRLVNAPFVSMGVPYSAGGLVSTVEDLAIWDSALDDHKLLGRELQSKIFSSYRLKGGRGTNYGFGWFVHPFRGYTFIEHGGRINGFDAHVLKVPEERVFVAVLSNVEGHDPSADFVATKIATYVLGKPYNPKPRRLSAKAVERLLGAYQVAGRGVRCIDYSGGRLFIRKRGGDFREAFASSGDSFFLASSFDTFRFVERSALGQVGLIISPKYGPETFAAKLNGQSAACN